MPVRHDGLIESASAPKGIPRWWADDTGDYAAAPRYLRHRAVADEAFRLRQRVLRRNRIIIGIVLIMFYFMIGRDLLAVARAKKDVAVTEVRKDTHQISKDLSKISEANRLASDQKIPLKEFYEENGE